MATKTRQQLVEEVEEMCAVHGCSEKIRKLHLAQYVDRNWRPHPPKDFEDWWSTHPGFAQGIDAKRAYNVQRYSDEYLEAKAFGIETAS